MPENNRTEMFLKSLAAVSRMNFQIWDSRGSLCFTTRERGFNGSDKSRCLKCAKEIILSGTFVYASHCKNRYTCGVPLPLEKGTTGALLTLGSVPQAGDDGAHPRQMEIFLKQIAMREGQEKVDLPQAPQHVNEHPNPRFEDLCLFANITKQFRSLRLKQPVLSKLMHQILNDMHADAAFLLLPEHPQYNQMEFHENRFTQNRKTNYLRQQMYKFASQATRRISDHYCIINDSRDNKEFSALSKRPYRFMAIGVRHLKKSL